MQGDLAMAVMVIRLSSPARYGNGRKTSINKTHRFNVARLNFAQERGF
jgi:hypothetical protein